MSLSSVYEAHAAVCSKMAASARDLEIRNRWIELADQWRQKARACEVLSPAPTPLQSSPQPKIADAPPVLPIAPAIAPRDVQLNRQSTTSQPAIAKPAGSYVAPDHDWMRLLADIRGK
jgi:hypothetical protein